MKVVIDARFYGTNHTGPGRYVENLLRYLSDQPVLIVTPNDATRPELARFKKVISHTHPYSLMSQIEIPYLLWQQKPDLVHFPISSIPVFWYGKIVVTFHDLIKHVFKGPATTTRNQYLYWIKYYAYLLVDYISAHRASIIITPTFYWQKIISQKYHIPLSKIKVTYEAVDENFLQQKPVTVPGLKKPFLVHTGNLYPHKNLEVVFKAVKNIQINFYLICARSVFALRAQQQIRSMKLETKVKFLGKLSDAEIKFVYKNALALVFPSKVEGFGLNGLEAMSVGCPVISSNASCLPEVYGPAALYFDPDSPEDLVKNVHLLQKNLRLQATLIKNGYSQVKKYSWQKMARQTWEIYQNA